MNVATPHHVCPGFSISLAEYKMSSGKVDDEQECKLEKTSIQSHQKLSVEDAWGLCYSSYCPTGLRTSSTDFGISHFQYFTRKIFLQYVVHLISPAHNLFNWFSLTRNNSSFLQSHWKDFTLFRLRGNVKNSHTSQHSMYFCTVSGILQVYDKM